jgi:hypothetical protein
LWRHGCRLLLRQIFVLPYNLGDIFTLRSKGTSEGIVLLLVIMDKNGEDLVISISLSSSWVKHSLLP